jgi:arylsulfatase A-like enzyme
MVDTYVGEIFDTLEAEGHADETVSVFTSDHGDMMGSHQLVSKMVMFEEAVRVPLMVRVPGAERNGERVSTPVSQIDLVPTLLDAMGQDVPDHLHGESWVPFLEAEDDLPRDHAIVQWNGPNVAGVRGRVPRDMSPGGERSESARPYVKPEFLEVWSDGGDKDEILAEMLDPIRTIITEDGWKLNYRQSGGHELYNLDTDPKETQNLATDPEYAEKIEMLAEEIFRWQRAYRDPVYHY